MNNKNHPTIISHADIADICRPLKKLGISYFAHVNIKQGKFSAITNNPDFQTHYINNEYYNTDIHTAKSGVITDCFVWDSVERKGKSFKMHQEAAAFGVQHTFTMLEKNQHGDHYYHFATNSADQSINQVYLTNQDLLKLFIMHFNYQVGKSKLLSSAYDMQYEVDEKTDGYIIDTLHSFSTDRQSFVNDMVEDKKIKLSNGMLLSIRELEILYWMHNGKTISDISKIIGIAEVTINKYIAEMKRKLNCYTHFQLGEYFSDKINLLPNLIMLFQRSKK